MWSRLSSRARLHGRALSLLVSLMGAATAAETFLPLEELRPGMEGEVRTVFSGSRPESFRVKVTGIVQNALGPGKSLILCELTDPRLAGMGAAAGMSGSPLRLSGRLAGALSYQVQSFETVHYAGFTPAADLAEVRDLPLSSGASRAATSSAPGLSPLRPVFSFGGVSPSTLATLKPFYAELGLEIGALSGGGAGATSQAAPEEPLEPGSSVAVALAMGDLSISGTGTVSMVDGKRVTAFGHPLLGLGEVELPLCRAEIVTILPSSQRSVKIANLGPMVGTLQQDRLSAVSGTLGIYPRLIDVAITLKTPAETSPRVVTFQAARHPQVSALIVATGILQAVNGANQTGRAEGYRVFQTLHFDKVAPLSVETVFAGPNGVSAGLFELLRRLSLAMNNPWERSYPERIQVEIEALPQNPSAILETFQLSRAEALSGEILEASLSWRPQGGEVVRERVIFPAQSSWAGKTLEVLLVGGRQLDELTDPLRLQDPARYRGFASLLETLRTQRRTDGLYLAVVERTLVTADQSATTAALPSSLERVARQADETRFPKTEALVPLYEVHLLPGRVVNAQLRRPLRVAD